MPDEIAEAVALGPAEVLGVLTETIVQVDDELSVLQVNHPRSEVFRRPPRLGEPLGWALGQAASDLLESLADAARQSGRAVGEHLVGQKHYRLAVNRLESGPLFVIVFEDVTSRRTAEKALMETVRGKSSVLASVGNELQGPLKAVIAYAGMLARPESDFDESYRQALVEHMADQAWGLAGIIDDLLAVAHTEIGDLHVAEVPVNLFANTAQVLESMGERGTRITVTGDRSTTALGDPGRLRQVVRNLLSNALVHGAEPITIDLSSAGGHAVVRVKDRGKGVPPELGSQELFTRPVEGAGDGQRTGIGLWVASELAGLMKGRIEYRREYGLTIFEVTLRLLSD